MDKARVLVLGAGFAGLAFLRSFSRAMVQDLAEVTVIDRNSYHTVIPRLHQIAVGTVAERQVALPLPQPRHIRWLQGEVTALAPKERQVRVGDQFVPYDYLVLALGSTDRFFGIPGAQEHSCRLRTLDDARRAAARLTALPDRSRVTIVGGGLTGVELAGEIAEAFGEHRRVLLVERGSHLVSTMADHVVRWVEGELRRLNVEVRLDTAVTQVLPDAVELGDGDRLRTGMVFWAAGVAGLPLYREAGLPVEPAGRILVNDFLQVEGFPEILALGDAAAVPEYPSAQLADQHGMQAGANLLRRLRGEMMAPVMPVLRGTLGSLGKGRGFGLLWDVAVTGRIPDVAKMYSEARHRREVEGWEG